MAEQDFILNVITRFRATGANEMGAAFRRELESLAAANLTPRTAAQAVAATRVAGERQAQALNPQDAAAFRREMSNALRSLPPELARVVRQGIQQGALGQTGAGPRQLPTNAREVAQYMRDVPTPPNPQMSREEYRRYDSALRRGRMSLERQAEMSDRLAQADERAARQQAESTPQRRSTPANLNRAARGDTFDGVARESDYSGLSDEEIIARRQGRAATNRRVRGALANDPQFAGDLAGEATARQSTRAQVNALLVNLGEFARQAAAAAREMERVRQQVAEIRADDPGYLNARAGQRRADARRDANVEEQLAGDDAYANDRSRRTAARNIQAASETRATLGNADRLRAQEDAAVQRRVLSAVRETAVLNRLTASEEDLLRSEALRSISNRRYQRALQNLSGEIERSQNAGGSLLPGGSRWQRLQAFASSRTTGQVQDPRQFQTFGQGMTSRAITTAGYGLSGAALYGGVQAITGMIQQAQDLDRVFASIRRQFQEVDDAGSFPQFRRSMLEIARDAGVAGDEVATVGFQMRGAFGNTTRAIDETRAAIRASIVTGIEQRELTDSLTGAAISYGTSIEGITDKAIGLEERFGVLARESLKVFGDMAASAQEAGLSLDQLGAILGTIQQASGRSGTAIAESLGRILPAIGENSSAIVEAYRQTPALQGQANQMAGALGAGQTGQVLTSLLQNWTSLDRGTQQYFTTLLGGRREAQTLNALFNNSSRALEELNRTESDAGKTTRRFNDIQGTLTQTLNRARQEFLQIGDDLARAGLFDALKLIAGAALATVQAIGLGIRTFADFNEALGSIPGRILAIAAAMLALRTAVRTYRSARDIGGELVDNLPTRRARAAGLGLDMLTGLPISGTVRGAGADVAGEVAESGLVVPSTAASRRATTRAGQEAAEALTAGAEAGMRTGFRTQARGMAGRLASFLTGIIPTTVPGPRIVGPVAARVESLAATAAASGTGTTAAAGAATLGLFGRGRAVADRVGAAAAGTGRLGAALRGGGAFLRGAGPLALVTADIALIDKFFSDRQKLQEDLGTARGKIEQSLREKSYDQLQQYDQSGTFESSFVEKAGSFIVGETTTDTLLHRAQNDKRRQILEAAKRNPEILAAMGISQKDIDQVLADINRGGDTGRKAGQRADVAIGRVQGTNRDRLMVAAGQVKKQADNLADGGQTSLRTMQQTQAAFDAGEVSYGEWFTAMQAEVATLQQMAAGGRPELVDAALQAQRQLRQGIQAEQQRELERSRFLDQLAGADPQQDIDRLTRILRENASKVAAQTPQTSPPPVPLPPPAPTSGTNVNGQLPNWMLRSPAAEQPPQRQPLFNPFGLTPTAPAPPQPPPSPSAPTPVAPTTTMTPDERAAAEEQLATGIRQRWMNEINRAPSVEEANRIAQAGPQLSPDERASLEDLARQRGIALANMFGLSYDEADSIRQRQLSEALSGISLQRAQTRDPGAQAALDAEAARTQRQFATNQEQINNADAQAAQAAEAQRQNGIDIQRSRIELARAQAGGDPIAEASAAQREANLQMQDARGAGPAALNRAAAAQAQANDTMRQAQVDVAKARIELLRAQHPDDALAQARAQQQEADIDARNARGPAAQLRAQAARIAADRAVEDAIELVTQSQEAILTAMAEAQGNHVESAQIAVRNAQRDLETAQRRGAGSEVINNLRAELINAQSQQRQAYMSEQEELIQFNLDMGYYTRQQAIAQYELLLAVANPEERRRLMLQIRQLQQAANGSDLQFNLPGDINLPTLYTARRMNQDAARLGAGQNYANGGSTNYDNRNIQIVLNASNAVDGQAAVQTIVDALNEAPRYGTQPRLY